MGSRHRWRRSLQQLAHNRRTASIVYCIVVAVMIFILSIHMVLEQRRFTIGGVSRDEKALIRRLPIRNQVSEQRPAATERSESGLTTVENAEKPINLILVSSAPRGGSSFLGELLSSPRQALYLFEPFWYYANYKRHILKHIIDTEADKIVKNDLHRLLECRISEIAEMFDSRLAMAVWRKPAILAPLTVRQRASVCQDLKLRVIKVVRPKLASVLPLLEVPDLDAHIIQLVRDPRAIVNSVSQVKGWNKHLTPSKACLMIRNDIEASLDFAEHPRLLRVRYEDVVARPVEESRKMFNWLGLELPPEVHHFLDLHTRQTNKPPPAGNEPKDSTSGTSSNNSSTMVPSQPADAANAVERHSSSSSSSTTEPTTTSGRTVPPEEFSDFYGTIRDAKFDGLQWLKSLDPELRKETETVCQDVLRYLDYPLVYPQERPKEETTPVTKTV